MPFSQKVAKSDHEGGVNVGGGGGVMYGLDSLVWRRSTNGRRELESDPLQLHVFTDLVWLFVPMSQCHSPKPLPVESVDPDFSPTPTPNPAGTITV